MLLQQWLLGCVVTGAANPQRFKDIRYFTAFLKKKKKPCVKNKHGYVFTCKVLFFTRMHARAKLQSHIHKRANSERFGNHCHRLHVKNDVSNEK